MLEHCNIDDAIPPCHADSVAEIPDRFWCVSPPPDTGDCRHPWIVPSSDVSFFNQFDKPSLTQNRVIQIETRKLDLLGMTGDFQLVEDPIIQGAIVFKFQRAKRMGNPFNRI